LPTLIYELGHCERQDSKRILPVFVWAIGLRSQDTRQTRETLLQHTYATGPTPPSSTRVSVSIGPRSRPNCPGRIEFVGRFPGKKFEIEAVRQGKHTTVLLPTELDTMIGPADELNREAR